MIEKLILKFSSSNLFRFGWCCWRIHELLNAIACLLKALTDVAWRHLNKSYGAFHTLVVIMLCDITEFGSFRKLGKLENRGNF